jgi:hypothetical protein
MPTVQDYVLDNGLTALRSTSTTITVCTAEPATWTAATGGATYLGMKRFGPGGVITAAIAAGSPNGRKVTTLAVTDGAISATSSSPGAVAIAITDGDGVTANNSRLLVTQTLSASQPVTSGNPFTLNAFDVRLPGA